MIGRIRRLFGLQPAADPGRIVDRIRAAAPVGRYGAEQRARDFRDVFLGSAAGRRALWQILAWCRLYRTVAVRGDAFETYRRDGERSIGLRILAQLDADPAAKDAAPER